MMAKKLLNKVIVILTLSLFCSALIAGAVSALNIQTPDDLVRFSTIVNNGQTYEGQTVYLMNDLVLSGIRLEPIGNYEHPFKGTFEGNGHIISHLDITKENDLVGLFGHTCDATINNLTLTARIVGNNEVGGLIGRMNGGQVNNCSVKELDVRGTDSVGGLIGSLGTRYGMTNDCNITNCSAFTIGQIFGMTNVGGLIGCINKNIDKEYECKITDCFASCKVVIRGGEQAGGLVGAIPNSKTSITHCITTGTVSGGKSGGLIGQIQENTSIDSCVALNEWIADGDFDFMGRICGNEGGNLSHNFAWDDLKINEQRISGGTLNNKNGQNVPNSEIWGDLGIWKWRGILGNENISVDDPSTIWHIDDQGNPWGIPYLTSQGIPSQQEAEMIQYLNPNQPEPSTTLITLEKSGGTGGTNQTTATVGSSVLNPKIISPTCEGYNLTGWFTSNTSGVMVIDANGTLISSTPGYVDNAGNWENQSTELTLYAQWEEGPTPILSIDSLDDFKDFQETVNNRFDYQGLTVTLNTNLNLSDWQGEFIPIGPNETVSFKGTFEGNGHTISNLNITEEEGYDLGLFGYTVNATINNLTLKNVQIFGDRNNIGGLIGWMNGGQVNNCSIRDVFVEGQNLVGGLIGAVLPAYNNSQITGCSVFGQVEGNYYVGGLIGGITAMNGFESKITDCFASCTVDGNSEGVGGLVGYSADQVSITHSFTVGNVTGSESVGGLIGRLDEGPSVENCVALNANISGNISSTGRICGLNGNGNLSNNFAWNETKVNEHFTPGRQDDENGENVSNSDLWSKLDYWKTVFGSNISVDGPTIWHIDVQGNPWGIPYLTSQGIPSQQEAEKIQYLKPDTPGPTSITFITLEKNGGTGGTDNTTATVGSSALNPEIISPTCEGYNLTGWFTSNTSGVMVIDANGTLIPSTEGYVDTEGKWINQSAELTLYAQWEEGPMPPTSTTLITLEKNGGTGGTDNTTATVGSSALNPEIISPTCEGYNLTGWFTSNTSGVMVIDANGTLIPSTEGYVDTEGKWINQSAELTLYAQWEEGPMPPTSTTLITLEKNGGTGGTDNTTATVGSSALNPEIISPTCEGYNLTGWFTSNTSGVMVIDANGTLIPSTEGYVDTEGKWINQSTELTLYAQWDQGPMPPTSTTLITLEKNGGTGGTDNTTATVGSSVLVPEIISPAREGYTLTGWFTNNTEGVQVIDTNGTLIPSTEGYVDTEGNWTNQSSELTLYAQWEEIPQSNLYINNGTTLVPLMNVGDRVNSTSGEGYAELKDNSSDGYVLELNNFIILNARLISPTSSSLVWSKVPLTIKLNNTESNLSSDSSLRDTIYCSDRLVIEGPGKLSIDGTIHGIMTNSTLSIENNAHVDTTAGVGLAATKLLITDNATVNATGNMTSGFGIFTLAGLEIDGNETEVTSFGNSSIGIKGPFTPETITIKSPLHVWNEMTGELLLNYSDPNNTYSGPEFGGMNGSTFKQIVIDNDELEPVPIEPGENYLTDTDSEAKSKGITAIEFNSTDIDGELDITPVDEHQKEIVLDILKKESKEGTILTSFDINAPKGGNFTLMVSGLKEDDVDYVMTYHYSDGWNPITPDYHYYDKEGQIGTYIFHSESFSPFIAVIAKPNVPPVPPSPHHGGGGGGGTTIITSQTPMQTAVPTVTPTDYPTQPTKVSPSAVPTVPATQQQQQSPIPIIGILSGLAVGGFLLTRLRK